MGCTTSSSNFIDQSSQVEEQQEQQQEGEVERMIEEDSFIIAKNSNLYLNNKEIKFSSLCCPELLDGEVNKEFEIKDTFKSLSCLNSFGGIIHVTRTYTLTIKSKNITRGFINGWNTSWGDWEWDENRLIEMDLVLSQAALHGIRLIVPIINQDFGSEDTNWVGNFTNLIQFRKGILLYEEAKKIDWWTDEEMINSMKLIIDKLLNRINTFNGKRYGNDPTILAWETGNEMNYLGYRTAPASWTITIAKHLKSLAPNTLVMDGSFARTEILTSCFNQEVLNSPFIDIFSYHYYGSGDINRVKKDITFVKKAGKVFIVGEYGFFDRPEDYTKFLANVDSAGGSGSLAWSLRPHSSKGGFKTHSEGNGIFSYHIPGWNPSPHPEFSSSESTIINSIRSSSFKMNKVPIPPYPIPSIPPIPTYNPITHKVIFKGVPWAYKYLMDISGEERQRELKDCCGEGENFITLQGGTGRRIRIRAVGVDGKVSGWSEVLII